MSSTKCNTWTKGYSGLCCTGISHVVLACREPEEVISRLAIFSCPKNHLKSQQACGCWLFGVGCFFFPFPQNTSVWVVELERKELVNKYQPLKSTSFYTSAALILEAPAIHDSEVTGTMVSSQMELSMMLWTTFKNNLPFSGMIVQTPS